MKNIRPDNAYWRFLWDYVCLWDEDERDEPQQETSDPQAPGENEVEPEDGDEGGETEDEEFEPDLDDENDDEDDDEGEGDFDPGLEPNDTDEEYEDESLVDEIGYEITEPENVPPEIPGYAIIHNPDGSIDYLREFDSWWAFATSAADPSLRKWSLSNCASQKTKEYGGKSWFGTETFAEAIDMALRRGWPEGRELLRESLLAVQARPKVYESLEFEVAGAFPCVPIFCAGSPAFMITDGSSIRSTKPIVRIDYNNWVTARVDIKSMMLRGAAILSLANDLEARGFSTELRIIGNSKAPYGPKVFRYSITYKCAGEPLDLDRAAFAIAHPTSMRRLAFAILEQHGDLERDFKSSYGFPLYKPNPTTENLGALSILFVPGSHGNETPDTANAAVANAAKVLLSLIELEAA